MREELISLGSIKKNQITKLFFLKYSGIKLDVLKNILYLREIDLIFVGGASIITARWSWKETKGGDGTIPTHPGMSWKDTW
jgi:hypothetical protein